MMPRIDSNRGLKEALLNGERLHFDPAEPEEQRTVKASWIAKAARTGQAVQVVNAIVVGELVLAYEKIQGRIIVQNCVFREQPNFRKTVFSKVINFNGVTFERGATFLGATFEDDLDLSRSEFAAGCAEFSEARFSRGFRAFESKFGIAAAFPRTEFGRAARFDRACFEGRANFRGAIFGEAYFPATVFNQGTDFSAVSIAGVGGFREARFKSTANFTDVHVGAESNFSLACFDGEATFVRARLDGRAKFETARFDHSADFGSACFGGRMRFTIQTCKGKVTFSGATFERPLQFGDDIEGKISLFEAEVDFKGAKMFSNVNVLGRFSGFVDFRGVRFDASADFSGSVFKDKVFFSFARIAHSIEFQKVVFERQTEFIGTFVATFASFDTARFLDDVSFKGASLRQILLSETGLVEGEPQFEQIIDLRGCAYERVQINEAGLERLTTRLAPYDRQPYTHLEKTLRAEGRDRMADAAYLRRQYIERNHYWQKKQLRKYIGSWFYWLVNYGVQPMFRLAILTVTLLVLGCWVFQPNDSVIVKNRSDEEADEHRRVAWSTWDAAAASAHHFLPVDVPLGARYLPADKPSARLPGLNVSTLASILKLAGFILVPVAVAALAGLLRTKS